MSRTYRRPSQHRCMGVSHLKKVKDGTPSKPAHSCENNGGCSWCEGNRLHKHRKQRSLEQEIDLLYEDLWIYFFED